MKLKNKMPNNGWRTIKSLVHKKVVFTVDEGKEWLNPSREKNEGTHRRKKVDEKSCVTPAGTSNELDVQNEWEENTHTHTWESFQPLKFLRRILFHSGLSW